MTDSSDKRRGVVVLPAAGNGRVSSRALRGWLVRGDLERVSQSRALLDRILDETGAGAPTDGRAALRMWGQTGDRPSAWIAAADPVYLEPELDRLRLHALAQDDLPVQELRVLFDHLQATLGSPGGAEFIRVGGHCYLSAATPLATSLHPPQQVDNRIPTDYLPAGADRASHRKLLSEIEMALHDHPVNAARESEGRPAINSLWLWGGGYAPHPVDGELPELYANDPLLRGHWRAQQSPEAAWPGSIAGCFESGSGSFVAVVPQRRLLESSLHELKSLLASRRVDELVMLFEDDLKGTMTRPRAMRFWRRNDALLCAEADR